MHVKLLLLEKCNAESYFCVLSYGIKKNNALKNSILYLAVKIP